MINLENENLKKLSKVIKKLTEIKAENTQIDNKEALKQAFADVKNNP